LEQPDLFGGVYDSAMATAAENLAQQTVIKQAVKNPEGYLTGPNAPKRRRKSRGKQESKPTTTGQQPQSQPKQQHPIQMDGNCTAALIKSMNVLAKALIDTPYSSRGRGRGGRTGVAEAVTPAPAVAVEEATPPAEAGEAVVASKPLAEHYPRVGGRLRGFGPRWAQITCDEFVLATITEGYRIEFTGPQILRTTPLVVPPPRAIEQREALKGEVKELLEKGAIVHLQEKELRSSGYYSHVFMRLKPSGAYRPILNLKRLNKSIRPKKFRMDTIQIMD
jgi:hypothetical protein